MAAALERQDPALHQPDSVFLGASLRVPAAGGRGSDGGTVSRGCGGWLPAVVAGVTWLRRMAAGGGGRRGAVRGGGYRHGVIVATSPPPPPKRPKARLGAPGWLRANPWP